MPKVTLPTTTKGWIVVLGSSMVGFVSGTLALHFFGKLVK